MKENKKTTIGPGMSPKEYEKYVKEITPTHSLPISMLKAFVTGGAICVIGQALTNMFLGMGLEKTDAGAATLLVIIFLTAIATGLGWFSTFTKFAGAGSLVPITGFANAVASPAIENKVEGNVYGIGCKIFTISGPVILYGIFASWVLGVVYYVMKMMGAA